MSLLLELGAAKDEMSSLHSQVGKDKEAMEEYYQKALELIFAYGYGCCVFKHNICGDQPQRFWMVCVTPSTHFLQSS